MAVNAVKRGAIAAALAAAVLLAGCATQVPLDDPLYQRVTALQHEVDQLQQLVKGQQFMSVVSGQQELTQRIADLQGQIQTLQHQLQQAQQRQQAVNRNFDSRLAALEGGTPALVPGAGAGEPSSGNQTGIVTAVPPGTAPVAGGTVSDGAAYRAAFAKLRAGNNEAAIAAFTQFIQQYPNSSLVPNAWYWMGETHYVNGEYQDAIANFTKVVSQYPDSAKAADAQLKIGYAQYAMGDFKAAQATFEAVIKRYPGTTPADLARQRLSKMGSQG